MSLVVAPGASLTVLAVDQPARVAVATTGRVRVAEAPDTPRSSGRRSAQQEVAGLVRHLRAAGRSRVDIADAIRERLGVNPRVALRLAHGWTQQEAADKWNQRWPDEGEVKTGKSFSRWEVWPAVTSNAPPFEVLARLAELYQCAVSDLVADQGDFRHLDGVHREAAP